ncbi:hypothetical protein [Cupriavidus sp. AcVe19-6a]|uniref:hypothetical protein n=1 Tax=Cupriavidus sp. AcVe19-6a TaxID=2821358 RepID=UPI001FD732F2|nr:hypothetical protein [Cupriavidus sp. AcVe19-6a]
MQHQPRRHFLAAMLGLACAGLSGTAIAADNYPSRPIRLVVPSAAGGSPDVLLRALGAEVTRSFGQFPS